MVHETLLLQLKLLRLLRELAAGTAPYRAAIATPATADTVPGPDGCTRTHLKDPSKPEHSKGTVATTIARARISPVRVRDALLLEVFYSRFVTRVDDAWAPACQAGGAEGVEAATDAIAPFTFAV